MGKHSTGPISILKATGREDGGCDGYLGGPHFKKEINAWTSPGGKVKMAKILLPMLGPEHSTYTEVFAGSAAIFMRKPRVATEVLNDSDEEIAKAYSTIQTLTDDDIDLIGKMTWTGDRTTFDKLYKLDPRQMGKRERLYRWLYINRFSFGNMVVSGFMPRSQGTSSASWKRLTRARDRLKGVSVYSGDYADALVKHDGAEALHYLDPPYPGHNARLKEAEFDEDRFYKIIKALKGKFLITYGIRGKFPRMIAGDKDKYRIKRIYQNRAFAPTGNMGSETRLGHLIVSNYEATQKGMSVFADRDYLVEDWEDGADRLYEALESGSLYGAIDFMPSPDMAAVAAAGLKKLDGGSLSTVQAELAEKIVKRRELTPNDVATLVSSFEIAHRASADAMAIGGDAGLMWSQERLGKMCEAEGMCGRHFYPVAGHVMPGAPVVVQENCVVLTEDGDVAFAAESEDVGDLIQKTIPTPAGVVRNVHPDGHNAVSHRPLYDLVLVPAPDFGFLRKMTKVLGEFSYNEGDTGVVSVQSWGKIAKDDEQVEPLVTKLMFHRRGLRMDDHWEGGTLLGTDADLAEIVEDGAGLCQMIMEVSRTPGAPGAEDRVVKGDMRLFDGLQKNGVIAAKTREGVGQQLELAPWCAGKQEDDYREFFLGGESLPGRCVFMKMLVDGQITKAVWTTAFVNDLPDSAFLYVASGGEKDAEGKTVPRSLRKFPYKDEGGKVDLPHVRNAIARIPQATGISADEKEKLQGKARGILERAKEGVSKADETWVLVRFEDSDLEPQELQKRTESDEPDFIILQKDAEKRIVLGPALVPEQTDLQGDIIGLDEIEKAAHEYLANEASEQGVMHRDFSKKLEVVESYIAPVDFEINGRKIVKGTWMLAFRILDDDTWEDVKKGVLRGFSIGGVARNSQKISESG